jgi:hypothetical protein
MIKLPERSPQLKQATQDDLIYFDSLPDEELIKIFRPQIRDIIAAGGIISAEFKDKAAYPNLVSVKENAIKIILRKLKKRISNAREQSDKDVIYPNP